MNKKAFIFDLDGVIVDTAKFHFLAWKKLADSLNINFTHEINEQLKGVSRVRSLEIILSQGNIQASQEDKNNWLLQKNEDYLKFVHQMDESEILPRVEEVLQFLKTNKQYVVLGSASKNARPILEKVNILHYFDAIVDGNDVANAKPVLGAFKHRPRGPDSGVRVFLDPLDEIVDELVDAGRHAIERGNRGDDGIRMRERDCSHVIVVRAPFTAR